LETPEPAPTALVSITGGWGLEAPLVQKELKSLVHSD